jgi:hypothetical protein
MRRAGSREDTARRPLHHHHIPHWLATDGMGVERIAAFYDDPVKKACDVQSMTKVYHLRSLSVEPGVSWQAQRLARFMVCLGIGMLRQMHRRLFSARADAVSGGALRRTA